MKTLYLHIGTPKTATSSIQKFLDENKETLEKHGYCFPESVYRYRKVNIRRNGHFLVNKVFGMLLAEKQQYQKAVMFLTYALQFIPDDIETLTTLQECYILLNDKMRAEILGDIIMVFE